jgi:hypothetical protein
MSVTDHGDLFIGESATRDYYREPSLHDDRVQQPLLTDHSRRPMHSVKPTH